MVEVVRGLRCPACDTPLSREGSSEGLCPRCLLVLALEDTSAEAEVLFEPAPSVSARSSLVCR